jgi:hypothetical protein
MTSEQQLQVCGLYATSGPELDFNPLKPKLV